MALRASRSTSTSSLQSKFASYAKSASTYADAKMADDYSQGQITGDEYKKYLTAKKEASTPGTSSYLAITKKLRSVDADIKQNELQTKVDLGVEDPAKLADVIAQRVTDEGIIEGTPEYNTILKAVVNLRDKSIDYEKKQKYQAYKEMMVENPSMAEKMYDDYLQTLPGRYNNGVAVQNAEYDATNFHNTRIKNEITRAINDTANELKAAGVRGSQYYATMREAYTQASTIAEQNGLTDFASTLGDRAMNADSSYQSSASAEIKSAGTEQAQLARARTQDLKNQLTEMTKNFNGDLPALQAKYQELLGSLDAERQINDARGDYTAVSTIEGEIQTQTDNLRKYYNVFQVGKDGKIGTETITNPDGTVTTKEPQIGDSIMVRGSDGNTTLKNITKINSDGTFEFSDQGQKTPTGGWNDYAVDPKTGMMMKVESSGIVQKDPLTGKEVTTGDEYYIQTPGSNVKQYVVKDANGNNMVVGEKIGEGIYRQKKEDGGYDYYQSTGKQGVQAISRYDASALSGRTLKDILAGSTDAKDLEIAAKFGDKVYDKNTEVLMDRYGFGKQAEALATKQAEKDAAVKDSLSKLNQENPLVQQVQQIAEAPTAPATPMYVPPTELIAPAQQPSRASEVPLVTDQGVNFAVMGRKDTIAPGYYRQRKADGGYDYVKEGFGNISVDDLARETRTNKNLLLDPNATKFR